MKAIILAGGFGTRLKVMIHDRPKVMSLVSEKPFLYHIIDNLRQSGIGEIILATGYLGKYIQNYFKNGEDFGVSISYSEESIPLGTGGAIKKAVIEKKINEPFLVLNGDTFISVDFNKIFDFHVAKKAIATVVLAHKKETTESGLIDINENMQITSFIEKPTKNKSGLVNSGTYLLDPVVLTSQRSKKRFSLEKDLFPSLIKTKKIFGFKAKSDFIDIGTPENLTKARALFTQKKERIISIKVPARISFAGGGTDLWEYYSKFSGVILGTAIKKYAYLKFRVWDDPKISINLLDFDKKETYPLGKILPYDNSVFDLYKGAINILNPKIGFELEVKSEFVAGSGLGSSSAIADGLVQGLLSLNNQKKTKFEIAKMAINLERIELKIPGGIQDQYLCALGSVNFLQIDKKGRVKATPVRINEENKAKLQNNLLLIYLGIKRSERKQQTVLREMILENSKSNESLEELKKIALKMKQMLNRNNLDDFGKLLDESWILKKNSSPIISNEYVDNLYKFLLNNGALGGKLLGAGGGGYLLIYISKGKQETIKAFLKRRKLNFENIEFDSKGIVTDEN